MTTTPSCTTPVPQRPGSPSVLDQFHNEDDSFDFDLVTSPGSKRCPTFKDYAEKIKQLHQENFQLRVRIFLAEEKAGVKTSSSDLAVLYSHLPNVQNGTNPGNNLVTGLGGYAHSTAQSSPSTTSTSAFESLSQELSRTRAEKAQAVEIINQLEEKLATKEKEIIKLAEEKGDILKRNVEIEQELASANDKIQKLSGNPPNAQTGDINEDEVERLACFAFGHPDEVEIKNAELEAKLAEKTNEVEHLSAKLEHMRKKLGSAEKENHKLSSDNRRYEYEERPQKDRKIRDLSESLKEMGLRCIQAENERDKLRRKNNQLSTENREKASSFHSDKLSAIQQVVGMLQCRMKELASFVETLLQLEAKKVVNLTGITDEYRENLVRSIEQSRMFSDSLDQLLDKVRGVDNQYIPVGSFIRGENGREPHVYYSSAGQSKSMFAALDRIHVKSGGVQCNILDASLINSLECANSFINKLRMDMTTLEKINIQLNQEKSELASQLKSVESNVNVLRISNQVDKTANMELANSKLKEENRKLTKRLTITEDALRHLHTQHAKLVGELKTLRSTYHKPSKTVGSTIVDSTRPSDSTSPDLGIDSGHDGAINSDDSNGNNYKEENRILRTTNRELALKLKQTRQALDMTLDKLSITTKEKEQVEKAICRQLHKTHTILRQAKRSVENFSSVQCQENIMPSS